MTRESGEVHASHWRRLGACAPLLGRRRSVAAAARLCKQGRLTAWQAKGPPTQHDDVRRGVSIAEHNREQEGCPLSNHKHSSEPPPPCHHASHAVCVKRAYIVTSSTRRASHRGHQTRAHKILVPHAPWWVYTYESSSTPPTQAVCVCCMQWPHEHANTRAAAPSHKGHNTRGDIRMMLRDTPKRGPRSMHVW